MIRSDCVAEITIGCNYAETLVRIAAEGRVELEWLKLSREELVDEELSRALPVRPVLLHILGSAGESPEYWDSYDWDRLSALIRKAGSPHIALHLRGPVVTARTDGNGRSGPEALVERIVKNVRLASGRVPVPLLLENVPYYRISGDDPFFARPEVFSRVIQETGTGMLLDTSHLRVSAHNLGLELLPYVSGFPLDRVREIHLAGPRMIDGRGLVDAHREMHEEDFRLFAWVLERTPAGIVTLEYGGTGPDFGAPERNDPAAFERQLTRIRALTRGARGGRAARP